MIAYIGLWLLMAMTANMWALTCVVQSGAPVLQRLIWCALLLIPVLGFFGWFLLGPRARAAG